MIGAAMNEFMNVPQELKIPIVFAIMSYVILGCTVSVHLWDGVFNILRELKDPVQRAWLFFLIFALWPLFLVLLVFIRMNEAKAARVLKRYLEFCNEDYDQCS